MAAVVKREFALDANVLFDLAADIDAAHDFSETFSRKGYRLRLAGGDCLPSRLGRGRLPAGGRGTRFGALSALPGRPGLDVGRKRSNTAAAQFRASPIGSAANGP